MNDGEALELLMLADTMNALLGNPICCEVCEHDGRCSLLTGHDGDHETHGRDGRTLCHWAVT